MARLTCLIVMLLCLTFSSMALAKSDKSDPSELFIETDGVLLTVKAREIPHRQILEGIAKRLNLELIIAGPLEERHSLELEGRPLEEALKRAIFPASWAFTYGSAAGEPRITKVFVLPPQQGTADLLPAPPGRGDTPPSAPVEPSEAPKREQTGIHASLAELVTADDVIVRATAVSSLPAIGGQEAVDALQQALQDQEPWIRVEAVEALMKLPGEQTIQLLQQALEDEHPDVQQAAQEALSILQPGSK